MTPRTTNEAIKRELYYIDKPLDPQAITRAATSLEMGDEQLGHADREITLTLSPIDGEEAFTAGFVVRKITPSGDRSSLIYGSLLTDRSLSLLANYHSYQGQDGEFGTLEEVED